MPDTIQSAIDPDVSRVRVLLDELGWRTRFVAWICGRKHGNVRSMLSGRWPLDPDLLPWLERVAEAAGEHPPGSGLAEWVENIRDETGSDELPNYVAAWLPAVFSAICGRPDSLRAHVSDGQEVEGEE